MGGWGGWGLLWVACEICENRTGERNTVGVPRHSPHANVGSMYGVAAPPSAVGRHAEPSEHAGAQRLPPLCEGAAEREEEAWPEQREGEVAYCVSIRYVIDALYLNHGRNI